jgi:hypothetical protein
MGVFNDDVETDSQKDSLKDSNNIDRPNFVSSDVK